MTIKLSIITNTRGRLDLLPEIFGNIWKLAKNPEQIEHIVMYDWNDTETQQYLLKYIKTNNRIRAFGVIPKKRYKNLHDEYWNVAAKIAEGDIVFGLCNDTKILTSEYDRILLESFNDFKNKNNHDIVQILVDDDSKNHISLPQHDYCCWIILSKSAVNVIGGIAPKELISANADVCVYDLFNNCPYKSQIDLKDKIITQHISHYTGRRHLDRVSVEVEGGNYLTEEEILSYKRKLNSEIYKQLNKGKSLREIIYDYFSSFRLF